MKGISSNRVSKNYNLGNTAFGLLFKKSSHIVEITKHRKISGSMRRYMPILEPKIMMGVNEKVKRVKTLDGVKSHSKV